MQLKFIVPEQFDGVICKLFLRSYCKISYRLMVRLKHVENGITCNGSHIRVVDIVKSGDIVVLTLPEDKQSAIPSSVKMPPILFEDEHIIVLDKPGNMPVHPSPGHYDDTLANALSAYFEKDGSHAVTFRPIYRLDRDTSGVIVIAKHSHSAKMLAGKIDKVYLAVANGQYPHKGGIIDMPLGRLEWHGIMRSVCKDGERAVTHFSVIGQYADKTLLALRLETGRTHQIRAHFAHLGYPLCGDTMYGGDDNRIGIERQALHCCKVQFAHPSSGEIMQFISPLPCDIDALLGGQSVNYDSLKL